MVSEAPGESFSSPNVKVFLQSLQAGADGKRVRVTLSDGSSFFLLPEQLLDLALTEGMEVDEPLRDLLVREDEYLRCWNKALDLLDRRDHSEVELRRKLMQRTFSPSAIDRAATRLQELNLLDDRRFTESWLLSRINRKAEGRAKLSALLQGKGVSRTLVEEMLQLHYREEDEEEALRRAWGKLTRTGKGSYRSAAAALLRKGFPRARVFRFLEALDFDGDDSFFD